MNVAAEEEIKIEYYEVCDPDPLSIYQITNEDCSNKASYPDCLDVGLRQNGQVLATMNNSSQHDTQDISETCNITHMNADEIKSWYKGIDEKGKFACRFCNLSYSVIQTLRHHIKTKHMEASKLLTNVIKNNKRCKKFRCHICNNRFKLMIDLKTHVKANHNMDTAMKSCFYCNASFNSVKDISDHLLNEHRKLPNKTYICDVCGYRTLKKSHYNQHQNTHSSEKNHKCNYCEYATNYLPNLKIHERIHSNLKPYVCDFEGCSYQCCAKSALRSHQLKHYPDQNMLYCDKCSYSTVYRQSLKKHLDSHKRNTLRLVLS